MSQTKNFNLPDLGEGLPDATIVEWFVKEGDTIQLDEPLVSMETAKAVVEVPSPVSGKVLKLAGAPGDIVVTGSMLAQFAPDASMPQRAEGQDTGHHHGGPAPANPGKGAGADAPGDNDRVIASDTGGELRDADADAAPGDGARDDAGTVVGAMQSSNAVHSERTVSVGGVRAMPAVRALAKKLGVDLARVRASGGDGAVTLADVKQAAANGSAGVGAASAATARPPQAAAEAAPTTATTAAIPTSSRTPLSASGKPMRTQPPGPAAHGQPEPLKGVRRNMARVMAQAHREVVLTTLNDDADVHAWAPGNDMTVRLVRAIVAACQAVPALNAWFDGDALTRTLHAQVDIGIAVDTDDGLFVPALRNADMLDARGIREGVNRLRQQVETRSIAASELSGYTISLSNFGMFAGRYATPIVVPPCVAIVAAGRARHQLVPVMGGVETHKLLPLSLSFDHRACTGGEAARFLRAMIDDLALPG
ncbi:dihydrolipoamide acetyltransferase family protein [Xanthomonas bonasiae]|uniref:dihydrolipoamide acetyltransferase family protein n=1 Tax=Xanthomonas bonasiae TaxID=2810351 RepID=UPI00177CE85D|nr:dihydrolipoamide acetyltransferase family protein [Xanthomonas surreyensis]MBD7923593.1 2-oxo acid dehydrogenase subunit E2 [Xanthomonas surreyensis]